MSVVCAQLNDDACKTYLLKKEDSDYITLIDPVIDGVEAYVKLIEENGYKLLQVVDTHTHADHISGGASMKQKLDCAYIMHKNAPAECADLKIDEGLELELAAGIPAEIIYTPGHTADSISVIVPGMIFTGDALFLDGGGAGRDDLPGGDAGAHWETLEKFKKLDESLIVYPAHDYRDRQPSSLAVQKQTNPHLKERTKEEYIAYLEDLRLGPADWMAEVLKANYACTTDPNAAYIPKDSPACEVKGTMNTETAGITVKTIPPAKVKSKLEAGAELVLIDVREPDELEGDLGKIDGAINIPVGSFSARIGELEDFRNDEIITICRSGGRATTAAQILVKEGFGNVYVMEGGMTAFNQLR